MIYGPLWVHIPSAFCPQYFIKVQNATFIKELRFELTKRKSWLSFFQNAPFWAQKVETNGVLGIDVVKLWVNEKANYDYNSNSCVGGECLHYTQVVWRNSVRLGCAKVRCNNGGTFIGCNYDLPGNYVGQKPY